MWLQHIVLRIIMDLLEVFRTFWVGIVKLVVEVADLSISNW